MMTPAAFRAALQALRLTEPAAAAALGVSVSTISRRKRGAVEIPREIELALERLAQLRDTAPSSCGALPQEEGIEILGPGRWPQEDDLAP